MAFVNLPPSEAAAAHRQRVLHEQMASPDSFTRWQAKEAVLYDGLSGLGKALMQQAKTAAKEYERLERMNDDFSRNPFGSR